MPYQQDAADIGECNNNGIWGIYLVHNTGIVGIDHEIGVLIAKLSMLTSDLPERSQHAQFCD